jgi:Fe-S cluster biogenesis protein NfuA
MFLKKFFNLKRKPIDYGLLTDDDNKFQDVEKLIALEIKHFIRSHNGKIRLIAVRENIVYIEMRGTCSSCPAIEITLHGFIQRILKEKLIWFEKVVNLK